MDITECKLGQHVIPHRASSIETWHDLDYDLNSWEFSKNYFLIAKIYPDQGRVRLNKVGKRSEWSGFVFMASEIHIATKNEIEFFKHQRKMGRRLSLE